MTLEVPDEERPHLRIIDEKTWTEVQCRLTAVHLHYTRQSAAKSSISGRPSQYPFSGILVCDHCGSLMFVYGKGTGRRYRCTGNAKRAESSPALMTPTNTSVAVRT